MTEARVNHGFRIDGDQPLSTVEVTVEVPIHSGKARATTNETLGRSYEHAQRALGEELQDKDLRRGVVRVRIVLEADVELRPRGDDDTP